MRTRRTLVLALVLALMYATSVQAYSEPAQSPAVDPGAAAAAAALNIVYFPVRLVVTIVGAALGGFTGLFTGGNVAAQYAVSDAFGGPPYITPGIVQGEEPMYFGRRGCFGDALEPAAAEAAPPEQPHDTDAAPAAPPARHRAVGPQR